VWVQRVCVWLPECVLTVWCSRYPGHAQPSHTHARTHTHAAPPLLHNSITAYAGVCVCVCVCACACVRVRRACAPFAVRRACACACACACPAKSFLVRAAIPAGLARWWRAACRPCCACPPAATRRWPGSRPSHTATARQAPRRTTWATRPQPREWAASSRSSPCVLRWSYLRALCPCCARSDWLRLRGLWGRQWETGLE
jgi:hypothetical protein